MSKLIVSGSVVEFVLSNSATFDLASNPQSVTDGANHFTIGHNAARQMVDSSVSVDTAPNDLLWDGAAVQFVADYPARLGAAIRAKLEALGEYGRAIEQGGVTVSGFRYDTDDASRSNLGNAYQLAQTASSPATFQWWMSDGWHAIPKAQIISDAPLVAAWVESVYANIGAHFAAVAALTKISDVDAYSYHSGWPAGT